MGQHIHIDLWVGSMGLPGTHIMRLPVVCSAPMDLQQGYEERPMGDFHGIPMELPGGFYDLIALSNGAFMGLPWDSRGASMGLLCWPTKLSWVCHGASMELP